MSLQALLKRDDVIDVVQDDEAIYVIVNTGEGMPPIYSDKRVEIVPAAQVHVHPQRLAIISGASLRHETNGAQERTIYTYDLSECTTRQKQTLAHKLYGTGGRKSQLEEVGGHRLGRGAFWVPLTGETAIEALLKAHNARYEKHRVLLEERP